MYGKILIPTDGSQGAEVAVDHAFDLAEKYDSGLHILYVVDVRLGNASDMWANMLGQIEEKGRKAAESIETKANKKGLETVTEIRRGIPHKEINNYADEENIDLIVMGTHGRTGLDRVLLGSVAEKIIRTSEVPVMTVGRKD